MLKDATTTMKGFVISAHPYAFDVMFVPTETGKQWTGAGLVIFHACGGGVNKVWALVEADDEGLVGLQEAGFNIRIASRGLYVGSSGENYVVRNKRRLVCKH